MWDHALAAAPANARALCGRGFALQNLDRLEEAIASYRQAIELDPQFAEAHYDLGTAPRNAARAIWRSTVIARPCG